MRGITSARSIVGCNCSLPWVSLAPTERTGKGARVGFILWIIAVALVVWGIVNLVRGAVLAGILLIIAGLLVGPGGVSIFD